MLENEGHLVQSAVEILAIFCAVCILLNFIPRARSPGVMLAYPTRKRFEGEGICVDPQELAVVEGVLQGLVGDPFVQAKVLLCVSDDLFALRFSPILLTLDTVYVRPI